MSVSWGISRSKACLWGCIFGAFLLFAAANAHLLYVAVQSQSECVPHVKGHNSDAGYQAAKSDC
jgi:hypothetical protein